MRAHDAFTCIHERVAPADPPSGLAQSLRLVVRSRGKRAEGFVTSVVALAQAA